MRGDKVMIVCALAVGDSGFQPVGHLMPMDACGEALPMSCGEGIREVAAKLEAWLAPSVGHRADKMRVSEAEMAEEEVEDVVVERHAVVCPILKKDIAKDEDYGMVALRGDEPVGDIARRGFAGTGVLKKE